MPGLSTLLTSLTNSLTDLAQGQNVSALTDKARSTWISQSSATQGAIAGGLIGLLLSGNARKLVGAGASVGGAALIGSLAMQAYAAWQAENAPAEPPQDMSHRLLQAMVAATQADGVVTDAERAAITAQLKALNLSAEAEAMIAAELDRPLDIDRIAALASTPEEAASLYTASLLVIDRSRATEQAYLQTLATRLKLDPALVQHLEANVPST